LDIKWKKYSYSMTAKIIAFVVVIICFTSAITVFLNTMVRTHENFGTALEESYYQSEVFMSDSQKIWQCINNLIEYKSEEHILNGGTVTADKISAQESELFDEFKFKSKSYNPNLSTADNYEIFKQVYADKIAGIREDLIKEDLSDYRKTARRLNGYNGVFYYAQKDDTILTNSPNPSKYYFKSLPSYMVFDPYEQTVFPAEIKENKHYHYRVLPMADKLETQDVVYIGFSNDFLKPQIAQWEENKKVVTHSLYLLAAFLLAMAAAFIYLILVVGRKPEDEHGIHLNSLDRIYNDINLGLCFLLIALWSVSMVTLYSTTLPEYTFPVITLLLAIPGLLLVLSLVKHIKNRTFFKHTLIYSLLYKLYEFIKDVYNSGSVAVKVVLIVIGYPLLVGLTIYIFPVTIGLAAWLALKKAKEFIAIKEGVKKVKEGDFNHIIDIPGEGELALLAADINSITDGLNKAVENEIKSERLKSELITNVSHDIRTPLTSIITYVDLLKKEEDPDKIKEYINVIDQKSERLKILTDDLFDFSKASSGNIPVNLEVIDLVSLLTQGLGEFDDKIKEHQLDFKLSYPADKVYVKADGKLLWRAIENLLLNIFKYALEGSRVYIDMIDSDPMVKLIIKNISAYELNISSEELMERFVRGDVARSTQGSGLGLSIAKSLIENQQGNFHIEVDGDLFKAVIEMPGIA